MIHLTKTRRTPETITSCYRDHYSYERAYQARRGARGVRGPAFRFALRHTFRFVRGS